MTIARPEVSARNPKGRRTGFTTGACSAAASKAVTRCLVKETVLSEIETTLPNHANATFALARCEWNGPRMLCSVIKDAGDDPDCTHGEDAVKRTFAAVATKADIAIIEGVMGLYDGASADSDEGSTAEIALDGAVHPMCNVLPGETKMCERLQALGYVEIETVCDSILSFAGVRFRGHQFRYSNVEIEENSVTKAYAVTRRRNDTSFTEGYQVKSVLASYIHAHWASNPVIPVALVDACSRSVNRSI